MGLSDKAVIGRGLNSPDPLVREAYLMAYDYINYVTAKPGIPVGPAPSHATAALRHAGDELLTRFPIFFRRWPRVFQDVTDRTACSTLVSIWMSTLHPHDVETSPGAPCCPCLFSLDSWHCTARRGACLISCPRFRSAWAAT